MTIYDSQPSPGGAFTCVPAAPCAECTDTALLTALLLNKQELEKHKYSLMARVSAAKMSKSPPSAASFVCRQSGSVVSCHVWTLKVSTEFCYCRKEEKIFLKNMQPLCAIISAISTSILSLSVKELDGNLNNEQEEGANRHLL